MPIHINWCPNTSRWIIVEGGEPTACTAVTYFPGERSDIGATALMIAELLNTDPDAHLQAMVGLMERSLGIFAS